MGCHFEIWMGSLDAVKDQVGWVVVQEPDLVLLQYLLLTVHVEHALRLYPSQNAQILTSEIVQNYRNFPFTAVSIGLDEIKSDFTILSHYHSALKFDQN